MQSTPISQPACFLSFHTKSFLRRVSPRYRNQLAFSLFPSKASWDASHPDIATCKLFLFSLLSPQMLPGTRLTPRSQPASSSSFHPKSFPGRVSPRYRNQQAFPLFPSDASRGASHPEIATSKLSLFSLFSHQKLPESRFTPISRPTSFLFFIANKS